MRKSDRENKFLPLIKSWHSKCCRRVDPQAEVKVARYSS